MDQGVIHEWKAIYRRNSLGEMMKDIETQKQRRDEKKKAAGMKGIADGYDPHMLDVSRLCAQSWDQVGQDSIASCWEKSGILPVSDKAVIMRVSGETRRTKLRRRFYQTFFRCLETFLYTTRLSS